MQELAKRPKHWVFWQFIPVVGWFITPGIFIEFVKFFGRFTFGNMHLRHYLLHFIFLISVIHQRLNTSVLKVQANIKNQAGENG